MIRPSEFGLVMRRERNPIMRGLGARYYVEPTFGGPITARQLDAIKRIAAGEAVDESDAGVQIRATTRTTA